MRKLLLPEEVDEILRLPDGRAQRMAKRGKLPHVVLPTGEIRFDREIISALTHGHHEAAALELEVHSAN